jgi:hypothetical protein
MGFVTRGASVPSGEQTLFRTVRELNAWNAREFAQRPAGHTVEQSLEQMRVMRQTIRKYFSSAREKDLDGKAWMPLFGGWTVVRDHLQAILLHNIAEYVKLWIRTGKHGPRVNPGAMHFRLEFMMKFIAKTFDKNAAVNKTFTMVWNFMGPGGGAWTFSVRNGTCTLTEVLAPDRDLMIIMEPETFQKLAAKMEPPPWLILTGQMKVNGFARMGTFAKLFPEPKPDQFIQLEAQGAALG